jgi:hypothetical protein
MNLCGRVGLALVILGSPLTLAACSGPSGSSTTSSRLPSSTTSSTQQGSGTVGSGVTDWAGNPVSETAIPLGDGKLSTSPKIGYEDSCTLTFQGGGARATVPWIDTSNSTWNLAAKVTVEGTNTWANATHSFTLQGSNRVLTTNDLPNPGATGNFPISRSDPAYQYDTNPNSTEAQAFSWTVPTMPVASSTPLCTGLGPIGVFTNGVVMFNALDGAGRDAGAHEVQDSCDGHPQASGIYHYHDFSACLDTSANSAAGSSTLVGYALDGYGVYLERDGSGNLPTDADLDACHGRTSTVMWDGKSTDMYHYDVTLEYPYFVGCFHGSPASGSR